MNNPPLRLRPLRLDDIPALMVIEEQVFPLPWPASAYRSELTSNSDSFYLALQLARGLKNDPQEGEAQPAVAGSLLGYGGFWLFGEEAHLFTIAIAPRWQGRGLGEWLLLGLLDAMQEQGALVATLEVRAGNKPAQSLYRRLGFQVVGRRRRYYSDNWEDALIMTSPPLRSPEMLALRRQRQAIVRQRLQQLLAQPSGGKNLT